MSEAMRKAAWLNGPDRNVTRFGERAKFREGLYRLSPKTYAWMVPNGSWGETNFGLIDCGGKSIVIDTGWDLRCAHEFLDGAADLLARSPVDSVINTHADGDHCWGNQLFGNVPIIATHACIGHMHHVEPKTMQLLARAARVMKILPVAGIDVLGHYVSAMVAPYDFTGIHIVAPNQGFSGERTITLNGIDVVLMEMGPAHTPGDAMIFVPCEKVLYAGDIVFTSSTPVVWAGPVANITGALRKVLSLDADVIVAGHGPLATRADVELQLAYWELIQEELDRRRRQGRRADAAAADLLLSAKFQATPFAAWDSPERLLRNAQALYEEWGERPARLPEKLARLDTLRRQGLLALRLPEATPQVMHRR
ncbi:MBL fold metallo-hydrolase [Taklimakanibacter deserti]|uniref:MBL fold metallo-hydrolase n=1 Tax=Taklimakanibacter deserti TaxID=2267839 RepID=UPI000E648F79